MDAERFVLWLFCDNQSRARCTLPRHPDSTESRSSINLIFQTSKQEAEICVENGDLSEDYENGDSFVCWTALEHQLFTEYGRVRTRKQARIAF
ncbi:MAG: hypothetical protein CL912_27620 [Deltaproteobacteria bacterium]|nr:hypothetical protein [Deltaproteobacteria bacterium]